MNEKLNIQNLIELLAEKHGMDKADAESFVNPPCRHGMQL